MWNQQSELEIRQVGAQVSGIWNTNPWDGRRSAVKRVGDNAVQFLLAHGMIISGAFGNRDF